MEDICQTDQNEAMPLWYFVVTPIYKKTHLKLIYTKEGWSSPREEIMLIATTLEDIFVPLKLMGSSALAVTMNFKFKKLQIQLQFYSLTKCQIIYNQLR